MHEAEKLLLAIVLVNSRFQQKMICKCRYVRVTGTEQQPALLFFEKGVRVPVLSNRAETWVVQKTRYIYKAG